MSPPVPSVAFSGISKRYPGVQALDDVSFAVGPGRVHALVGENGAGKSTLVRVLAGAVKAEKGEIRLDGEPADIRGARDAFAHGIAVVYQEFSLAADLSVAENVFLGRWPRARFGFLASRRLHEKTEALFADLGVRTPVRASVGGLSVAQQQMVEIARALSLRVRVLVLDEPSAVLTPRELESLFSIVRRLAGQGVSVIYISHRLDEIFELCDEVTVLRDGRHISTRPIGAVTRDSLIREMVGRPIAEEFPKRNVAPGAVALSVDRLSCRGRFRDVSFEVRTGEVLALAGLVGSGRSSVGLALFGAAGGVTGRVTLGGATGPFQTPRAAKAAGIAFVPEDRRRQGLLLSRSLRENVTLAHLRDVSVTGVLRPGAERRVTESQMRGLGIRAAGAEVAAGTLSGGNQQKVMVARWLQKPYRVVVVDEPTRGVDVGAKVEMYGIINRLAEAGAAVIMITSELPEAIGMADRIGVMAGGTLTGILDNRARDVTQEAIMRLAIGGGRGDGAYAA